MLILDVGCGENKRGDLGMDTRKMPGVDVVASASNIPFMDGTFREALAFEVLEHLENPAEALREIRRILKTASTLRSSVPNIYWCGRILRAVLGTKVEETHTLHEHINSWTICEIGHLLEHSQFKLVDYYYEDTGPSKRFKLLFGILRLNRIFKALTNHQLFFSAKRL